jgi:hypothetical protein
VRHAADLVQRLDAVRTDLAALPDGDHAEPPLVLRQCQQLAHHLPVAVLEDVQRQHQPGEQHHPEREQRQAQWHGRRLRPGATSGSSTAQRVRRLMPHRAAGGPLRTPGEPLLRQ